LKLDRLLAIAGEKLELEEEEEEEEDEGQLYAIATMCNVNKMKRVSYWKKRGTLGVGVGMRRKCPR
jgi:hypothetical protein